MGGSRGARTAGDEDEDDEDEEGGRAAAGGSHGKAVRNSELELPPHTLLGPGSRGRRLVALRALLRLMPGAGALQATAKLFADTVGAAA